MISVIAPHFVSPHPAELAAMFVSVLAAWKLPMLAAVAVAVASLASLNLLLGGY